MKKIKIAQVFVLLALIGSISPVPATGQGLYTKKAVTEERHIYKSYTEVDPLDLTGNPNEEDDDSLGGRKGEEEMPLKDPGCFFLLAAAFYAFWNRKRKRNSLSRLRST